MVHSVTYSTGASLDLVGTRTFASGVLALRHRVAR